MQLKKENMNVWLCVSFLTYVKEKILTVKNKSLKWVLFGKDFNAPAWEMHKFNSLTAVQEFF